MRNASNATFLVRLDDADGLAIYKPGRGERPLWDFEPGLYRREVAAYVLSEATGLDVVPPTVLRPDAPLGEGSLQWFVNADFSEHYFSLVRGTPRPPRSAAGDRRRSTSSPTTPIARAGTACSNSKRTRGRPRVGDRQRVVLLRRGQAAHRDLGVRRRPAARRICDGPRREAVEAPAELAGLLDDDEIAAMSAASPAARRHGDVPRRATQPRLPLAAGVIGAASSCEQRRRRARRTGPAGRSRCPRPARRRPHRRRRLGRPASGARPVPRGRGDRPPAVAGGHPRRVPPRPRRPAGVGGADDRRGRRLVHDRPAHRGDRPTPHVDGVAAAPAGEPGAAVVAHERVLRGERIESPLDRRCCRTSSTCPSSSLRGSRHTPSPRTATTVSTPRRHRSRRRRLSTAPRTGASGRTARRRRRRARRAPARRDLDGLVQRSRRGCVRRGHRRTTPSGARTVDVDEPFADARRGARLAGVGWCQRRRPRPPAGCGARPVRRPVGARRGARPHRRVARARSTCSGAGRRSLRWSWWEPTAASAARLAAATRRRGSRRRSRLGDQRRRRRLSRAARTNRPPRSLAPVTRRGESIDRQGPASSHRGDPRRLLRQRVHLRQLGVPSAGGPFAPRRQRTGTRRGAARHRRWGGRGDAADEPVLRPLRHPPGVDDGDDRLHLDVRRRHASRRTSSCSAPSCSSSGSGTGRGTCR